MLSTSNVISYKRNKSTIYKSEEIIKSDHKKSTQKLLLNRKYIKLPSIFGEEFLSPRFTDELLNNVQRAKIVREESLHEHNAIDL